MYTQTSPRQSALISIMNNTKKVVKVVTALMELVVVVVVVVVLELSMKKIGLVISTKYQPTTNR